MQNFCDSLAIGSEGMLIMCPYCSQINQGGILPFQRERKVPDY
ncbi:hypothetical protein Anapl_12148 [Anas platyrhynchos]|uniref:Uncharacterized protein n=1 Tax=Anas platyrhynchos TaxID=8839 RepID=R0JWN9_ANAPL|nr:hypothetical protein Anapl_12148 [Anas platyrhynchos]